MSTTEEPVAVVGCWRYPVKSLQGLEQRELQLTPAGVVGDRRWGIIDVATGRLLAAKRTAALLLAAATDHGITLPDGTSLAFGDTGVDDALSSWLGRDVRLVEAGTAGEVTYEMTFDPPNEDAEVFEIPPPPGTFLDLCALHIVTTGALAHCREARPDLDWDVRRFRPNLLIDLEGPGFAEDEWIGRRVAIGTAVVQITGPMLRCAMPLRPQPGLDKEPGLFKAMEDLHGSFPNHLGLTVDVIEAGTVRVGDVLTVA